MAESNGEVDGRQMSCSRLAADVAATRSLVAVSPFFFWIANVLGPTRYKPQEPVDDDVLTYAAELTSRCAKLSHVDQTTSDRI